MHDVAIIGVGMTPVTSGSGKSLIELFVDAAEQAIEGAAKNALMF